MPMSGVGRGQSPYTPAVTLGPDKERDEVHLRYPPLPRRELFSWCLCLAIIGVLGVFFAISWWVYAIGVVALVSWEATKLRLRRNADRFAETRF